MITTAMSSSPAAATTREELHFRRIDMRGFRRSDGLYEVEGRVTDRKPFDIPIAGEKRIVPAHEPIHDMGVVLVFDQDLLVHEVRTFTDAAPYAECPQGGGTLQALKGLRIAKGWSREVSSRLRGARSCTHLMEILIPLGTAAFQSLTLERMSMPEPLDETGRPVKIDSCYAYRSEGELVMRRWLSFSGRGKK